jgi:hypothetical protein
MTRKSKIKISSNRSFGVVFFIAFLIYALWPLVNYDSIRYWSLLVSFVFLFLGLLNSKILSPLNMLWSKFGILLGSIIAPIVMGFVFFAVVTPIGLFMRMINKDLLGKKYNKEKKTYWIKRDKNFNSMKKQF